MLGNTRLQHAQHNRPIAGCHQRGVNQVGTAGIDLLGGELVLGVAIEDVLCRGRIGQRGPSRTGATHHIQIGVGNHHEHAAPVAIGIKLPPVRAILIAETAPWRQIGEAWLDAVGPAPQR